MTGPRVAIRRAQRREETAQAVQRASFAADPLSVVHVLAVFILTSDAQTHPEHRVRERPDSAELERAFLRQTRSTVRQPRCSARYARRTRGPRCPTAQTTHRERRVRTA